LKYISRNLVWDAKIEGNPKLQQRCWVGMSNSCIGQGGEVKFQDYNEWTYHPLLEAGSHGLHLDRDQNTPLLPNANGSRKWFVQICFLSYDGNIRFCQKWSL
jgi:hypothetical protein